jgi:predicted nuclease of predicted toxin-antitoxin system
MRFLADESCDFAVVRALRSADHDVLAIAEVSPREEDQDVMERAVREGRLLITEDKDFGQLVYAKMEKTGGVIFIRFPARVRRSLPATVVEVVRRRGQRLIGSFTVLQPGRVRTGPSPRGRGYSSGEK